MGNDANDLDTIADAIEIALGMIDPEKDAALRQLRDWVRGLAASQRATLEAQEGQG